MIVRITFDVSILDTIHCIQKEDVNGNMKCSGAGPDRVHEVVIEFDVGRKTFWCVTGMCMPPNGKKFMWSAVPV